MSDPAAQSPLPSDPPTLQPIGATGLPSNVAAALAVMIPLIGGIVFMILERKERFVRFYCMQSIILGVLLGSAALMLSLVELIFQPIPLLGKFVIGVARIIYAIFALAWFVLYFVALFKAFAGKIWAIPYLSPMAKKYLTPNAP